MKRVHGTVGGLALVLFGIACSPEGDSGRCGSRPCGITLTPVATITDSEALGELRQDVERKVVRDHLGRLLTGGSDGALIYERDGSFGTILGRRGQGPGEFRSPASPLLGAGDSIHIYDYLNRRVSVFAPDLTLAREQRFEAPPTMVLEDGTYVVAQQLTTPEHAGYPIHAVDPTGVIQRSFGTDTAQHRWDLELVTTRIVGPSRDGAGVWAAPPGRYVLEKWDPASGSKHLRVEVDSDWFEESIHFEKLGERPRTVLNALWEDEEGLVWVLLRTAATDWTPPAQFESQRERPFDPVEYARDYDSVIEVVDSNTGRIVARQRFDTPLTVHPQGQILASNNLDNPNLVGFDLWTAHVNHEESP